MDTITQSIEKGTPLEEENMCFIRMTRTDKGISLFFKSKKIEDFMRKHHVDQTNIDSTNRRSFKHSDSPGWKDHLGYILNETRGLSNSITNYWGSDFYLNGSGPNLSFLLAKGLGEGVTFELEGIFSQSSIQKWATEGKVQIAALYREFLKSVDLSLQITLTELQ